MRFKERAWARVDWALAAVCAFLVYGTMVRGPGIHDFPVSLVPTASWAAPLLALLVAVPVGLRRRDPMGAFLLALVGCVLLISAGGEISRGAFLALALVLYTVAATRARTVAVVSLAAALVLLVVQGLILSAIGAGSGPATGVALILIIAWILGISAQQRRAYTARMREQVATAAVTEERLRIARELHDVVAHSMTVAAVQAGFGEYVFDSDPAQARAALGNIQHVTREALSDMQRLLGVLRQDGTGQNGTGQDGTGQDGPAAPGGRPGEDQPAAPARQLQLAPAPGLADLGRLVSTTAGAGVRVALTRTGDRRDIPAAIDQSAFRIVQEGLTNVVKHSGASTCQVIVGYERDGLTVEITDPGSGQGPRDEVAGAAGQRGVPGRGVRGLAPGDAECSPGLAAGAAAREPRAARADGTGHGILGMRERVSLCGGEFTAGPRPGHGFEVIAHFPLPALPQRRPVKAAEATIAEGPAVHATALPGQAR
jgi:signal transduction histidine kinase